MTDSQLNGFRIISDKTYGSPLKGNRCAVRTAVEMAVVPHRLSTKGFLAYEPNGNCWGWSGRLEMWVLYETRDAELVSSVSAGLVCV